MTDLREQVARAICDYPSGPSKFNSCCPDPEGNKRCQLRADAAISVVLEAAAKVAEDTVTQRVNMGLPPGNAGRIASSIRALKGDK